MPRHPAVALLAARAPPSDVLTYYTQYSARLLGTRVPTASCLLVLPHDLLLFCGPVAYLLLLCPRYERLRERVGSVRRDHLDVRGLRSWMMMMIIMAL